MKTTQNATGSSVHDAIRAEILRGDHPPGEPLRLAPLASRFNVSMSLVREALVRLSEQHLTVLTPNQGFRVVSISRPDLIELTELRVMIEGSALAQSIENGDLTWEGDVVAAHHLLNRAKIVRDGEPGSTEEWSRAHDRFHVALISACPSSRLLSFAHNLRGSSEIYLQLSAGASTRDAHAEHNELLELTLARETAAAQEALRRHICLTTELLLAGPLASMDG